MKQKLTDPVSLVRFYSTKLLTYQKGTPCVRVRWFLSLFEFSSPPVWFQTVLKLKKKHPCEIRTQYLKIPREIELFFTPTRLVSHVNLECDENGNKKSFTEAANVSKGSPFVFE